MGVLMLGSPSNRGDFCSDTIVSAQRIESSPCLPGLCSAAQEEVKEGADDSYHPKQKTKIVRHWIMLTIIARGFGD